MKLSSFWGNIAKLMIGSTVAQALIFLSIPIFTRYYHPEHFGVASVFSSIVFFLAPVSSLSYPQAIVLPKEHKEAVNLIYLSFFLLIAISGFLFIPFLFFSKQISFLFNIPSLQKFLWLVPVAVFSRGLYLIFLFESSRHKKFTVQMWSRIFQAVTDRLIILGSGILGYASSASIIVGRLIASFSETTTFIIGFTTSLREKRLLSFEEMKRVAIKYKKFPMFSMWTILLTNLTTKMPIFILAYFFPPSIVGLYAISDRVLTTPVEILGDSIRRVYYQRIANDYNQQKDIKTFFEQLRERLTVIALFPFLLFLVEADRIFPFVLGQEWKQAGNFAGILGLLVLVQFISTPLGGVFNVLGKQNVLFNFTVINLIARTSSLIAGGFFNSPVLALWLFVFSGMIVYMWMHLWIGKIIGICFQDTIVFFSKYIIVSVIVWGILKAIRIYLESSVFTMFVVVLIGVVYYIIIGHITGALPSLRKMTLLFGNQK